MYADHQGTDDQCSPISFTCPCPLMPLVSAHQYHLSVPHISAHLSCLSVPTISST
ncbi:unnamed protein product [Staurois parvus]|uniref:Uncharacterized protein n=1 Tax=Staurois parvus TaxID=386267 RepID=A0ABN9F2J2_9NEOB|nr:unnamed protein product [Staurois parvus]